MSLLLSLAVSLPPHGRVNTKCYTAWNADRSNLDVVWNGAVYGQPWTFDVEVSTDFRACMQPNCVQRLWCTDSGAVGRYEGEENARLHYTWLLNTSLRGDRVLAVEDQGRSALSIGWTNTYGHGTLLVVGDVLFFYTFYFSHGLCGLPRLSSLAFAEYAAGRAADELVTMQLNAFSVVGLAKLCDWLPYYSPIYPAGARALTISVQDWFGGKSWAVDVALRVNGSSASRSALVLSIAASMPSLLSTSREVLTVPGYACSASMNSTSPLCYTLQEDGTRYVWASSPRKALGMVFTPLSDLASFSLPATLWLHESQSESANHWVLAAFGQSGPFAIRGLTLAAIESLPDASCASSRRLFLVTRELPSLAEAHRAPLACEWRQVFPPAHHYETPFASTAVKWASWAEDGPLFVATDVWAQEYHDAGAEDTSRGDPSLEHVYHFSGDSGSIRLGEFSCPWESAKIVPPDSAVLRASVAREDMACVRLLLDSARVRADGSDEQGMPLLLAAMSPEMALLLVDRGADIQVKSRAGWTSLMVLAVLRQTLATHLARGAAVCTWPLNVFDVNRWSGVVDAILYPCEPGFYLRPGPRCTGLTPCEEGLFCPGHRARTNQKQPCPAGTYGPHVGMASSVQCRQCPVSAPFSPPASPDISFCAAADSFVSIEAEHMVQALSDAQWPPLCAAAPERQASCTL